VHIENPVDSGQFGDASRSASRARLGLGADELVAVSVARLVPQKAVGDAIDAVARCLQPIRLVVIGDGPERRELETRARARAAQVTFLGERHDVPALLPAFDAFVLSSRWEGEPIALLEAMAAAVPCIATATAGAAALLAGGAGHLVPIGDPDALAKALDDVVMLTPAARSALTAEARSRVQGRSPDRIAHRLAAVYEEALGRSRCG
jgi:glycosyltransferase involved in cell wall biosynthesis